jgi:hypothetical protein
MSLVKASGRESVCNTKNGVPNGQRDQFLKRDQEMVASPKGTNRFLRREYGIDVTTALMA